MSAPVLELINATVVKDDRRILDGLTLTIDLGEHTAIVGPNGAGKSFLTQAAHARGPPARAARTARRRSACSASDNWDVFDAAVAARHRLGRSASAVRDAATARGGCRGEAAVLSGFLASQGILRYGSITDEMRQRAADALARMGASHLARRWLDEMSSGEARRVLLARALVTSPRALVLDEPTTGLDLVARHDFMERVRQIARDGTTLILVTHHIDEIIPEIERVVLLRHGRIMASGPKRVGADRRAAQRAVRGADRARRERRLLLRPASARSRRLTCS